MREDPTVRHDPTRFRPYPVYKDSGVESPGRIPAHWSLIPVKRVIRFSTGWTPPTGDQRLYDGDHPWANISDLGSRVLSTTQKTISDDAVRESRTEASPPGSLLFAFKLSVGAASIAGISTYTNEAIATFLPRAGIDVTYLYWAAPVYLPQNAIENIYGAPLLNRERIANARLAIPPDAEQRGIAAFLDRQTAKIDALVAKKERLIELLREKRTTLVTRAVTKGLDPNVRAKGAHIESLDGTPAHWSVVRLKFLLHRIEQGWSPLAEQREAGEDEWAVLKVGCVNEGRFDQTEHKALSPGMAPLVELEIQEGDILLSRANTRELLGSAAVATKVRPRLLLCDKLYRLTVDSGRIEPRYLVTLLAARSARHQLEVEAVGASSSMQNITQGTIRDLVVAVPHRVEQRTILGFIDRETNKIDSLIAKIRDAIDRLKEFRTALISAAVTGKIDVRDDLGAEGTKA